MISLALYNTYDPKKLHEAHIRALARAAPLAYAYGFHLVLVGFPVENLREFLRMVEEKTTIGKGGEYLRIIAERKRVHVVPYPKSGFSPQFGVPIATTSHPEEKKAITPLEIARLAMKKSVMLLIGLGRKGLPKEIFKIARYHMDVTGLGVSLETCTAMGAVASSIATYLEVLKWRNGKGKLHGSLQS